MSRFKTVTYTAKININIFVHSGNLLWIPYKPLLSNFRREFKGLYIISLTYIILYENKCKMLLRIKLCNVIILCLFLPTNAVLKIGDFFLPHSPVFEPWVSPGFASFFLSHWFPWHHREQSSKEVGNTPTFTTWIWKSGIMATRNIL